MKKRLLRIVCAFLIFALFAALIPGGASFALYNDAEYQGYLNLSQDSQIPGLFRNDSVFSGYRETPLVISGGVEYVPLSLFAGLSGVVVNFSSDMSNFYIQNKNRNKYISFNIPNKYAVTGENKVYETAVQAYYGAHYVPLRLVCEATGIGCDTYNDIANKVYVIKVFTTAGLSAAELIRIHAPSIYQQEEPPAPPDNTPENIGRRNIYLSVAGTGLEAGRTVADTLSAYGIKAAFFLTREEILANPDLVRKIYTDGHTLGITFSKNAEELSKEGVLEEEISLAEDALYEIIKTKTRLVVLPAGDNKIYDDGKVRERLESLGLRERSFNIDARTDVLGGVSALAAVTNGIRNHDAARLTSSVHIKLTFSDSASSVIRGLYSLSRENTAVTFRQLSEGTE